jgi:hypothetical protein
MSLLPEVRKELYAAADRQMLSGSRASPGRRRWESVGTVLVIAGVVAVVVAVGAVFLSVQTSTGTRQPEGHGHSRFVFAPPGAFKLISESHTRLVSRDGACRPRPSHQFLLYGRPVRSITRVLAAFGTPASPRHRLSPHQIRVLSGQGNGIYAAYARTGVIDRVRYYVLPERNLSGLQPQLARCGHEWVTEFRKLSQQLPARERARAIEWGSRVIGVQARDAESPAGVQLLTTYGTSGSHRNRFISEISEFIGGGSDGGTAEGSRFTITPIIVPNSVASVTADYPAEHEEGHVRHQVITQQVRDNIVIFRVTGGWDPPSLTYRSASGAVIWSTSKH